MGKLTVTAANVGIFWLLAQTATYPAGMTMMATLSELRSKHNVELLKIKKRIKQEIAEKEGNI